MNINPPVTQEQFTPLTENEEARAELQGSICKISSVAHFLNKTADNFYSSDTAHPDRQRQKRRTARLRRYMTNDHNGTITETDEWDDLEGVGDDYFPDPKINTYFSSIEPQLLPARTKFLMTPKSSEIKYKRVAEFAPKHFEEWFERVSVINKRRREIMWNLIASGDTYRFLYLNDKKIAKTVRIPEFVKKQVRTRAQGLWNCPICTASGRLSELDVRQQDTDTVNCPQCGFEKVSVTPQKIQEIEEVAEYKEQPVFELDYEVPDSRELTVIWTSDAISEALAVIWTKDLPRCLIEQEFPNAKLPSPEQTPSDDWSDTEQAEADLQAQKIRVQRVWLSPAVYASARTTKPETFMTSAGDTQSIQPGQNILKEAFPKGLFYIRAGEKTILQTYEQAIGEVWTHTVHGLGAQGYGIGEWEACDLQFQKNEARTLRMQKLLRDSVQNPIVREGYIDEYPNTPGAVINVRDLSLEYPLDRAISRTPAADFPAEATAMEEQLDSDLQSRLGAMTGSAADTPEMNAVRGTATGYQMYQNHILERRRTLLQLRAENLDLQMFYQYWDAFKAFYSRGEAEQYFDDTPPEIIEWLYEMDIRRDFTVTVVPNSYMPKTKEQRQIEFHNWWTIAAPLYMNNPTKMQEIERQMVEIFDGVEVEEQTAEQTEAQLRLDRIIEAAQVIEETHKRNGMGITDANGFVSMDLVVTALEQATKLCKTLQTVDDPFPTMPIDVMLDSHLEFIDVYQDYLRSSNGRKLSQFVQMVIKTLIGVHANAAPYKEIFVNNLFNRVVSAQNEFEMEEQAKMAQAQGAIEMQSAMQAQAIDAESQAANAATEEEAMLNELMFQEAKNQQVLEQREAENSQKFGFDAARQMLRDEQRQQNQEEGN